MGARSSFERILGRTGACFPQTHSAARVCGHCLGASLLASARGFSVPYQEHSCSVKGHDQRRLPLQGILIRCSHASSGLRTPSTPDLLLSHPLTTPLRKVLALGNQALMNRAGQHRDALVPDRIAEVLTGDADEGGQRSSQAGQCACTGRGDGARPSGFAGAGSGVISAAAALWAATDAPLLVPATATTFNTQNLSGQSLLFRYQWAQQAA
jgi:hypothetical protein